MPIEIKELHIRIAVNAPPAGQQTSGAAQNGATPNAQGNNADQTAIIAECVEQVLQILQNKKER